MTGGYNDEKLERPEGDMIKDMMVRMAYLMIGITVITYGFNMLMNSSGNETYGTFCKGFGGKLHSSGDDYFCDILNKDGQLTRMKVLCVDSNCQLKPEIVNIKLHSDLT